MIFVITSYLILTQFKIYECGVASSMCTEYGKAVYVKTDSPILTRSSKQNVVSECGIVSVPLIVGGTQATEKEFPHMAIIGFGNSPSATLAWECGGSLISDLFILTAAHCLESREMGPAQKIKLGIINLDVAEPDMQERVIVQRISHPNYKPPAKANDIALMKMDRSVSFTPHVRPACLYTQEASPGRQGIAIGFGKLSYDADHGSKKLMKVLLDIYPKDECSKSVRTQESVTDSMICAGQMGGGKDTCQGDSGGPLQIVLDKPYCMYSVIGITSFGKFCGFANSPAIYTKVSSFIPWIENIVWK